MCIRDRAMIEGMTSYGLKKQGILIGSKYTIEGNEKGEKGIGSWHQSRVATIYAAEPGEKKRFETGKGSFGIEMIKVKHDEPSSFGFKLSMDGVVLGHVSDTDYIDSLGPDFAGCDCLVVNCIKPEADKYRGHLTSNGVIEILKQAKPKTCIITHMGMKMLRIGPAKEAERIQKESGVKTIAARDGMKYSV